MFARGRCHLICTAMALFVWSKQRSYFSRIGSSVYLSCVRLSPKWVCACILTLTSCSAPHSRVYLGQSSRIWKRRHEKTQVKEPGAVLTSVWPTMRSFKSLLSFRLLLCRWTLQSNWTEQLLIIVCLTVIFFPVSQYLGSSWLLVTLNVCYRLFVLR